MLSILINFIITLVIIYAKYYESVSLRLETLHYGRLRRESSIKGQKLTGQQQLLQLTHILRVLQDSRFTEQAVVGIVDREPYAATKINSVAS